MTEETTTAPLYEGLLLSLTDNKHMNEAYPDTWYTVRHVDVRTNVTEKLKGLHSKVHFRIVHTDVLQVLAQSGCVIYKWYQQKLRRIVGRLEDHNGTLADLEDEVYSDHMELVRGREPDEQAVGLSSGQVVQWSSGPAVELADPKRSLIPPESGSPPVLHSPLKTGSRFSWMDRIPSA